MGGHSELANRRRFESAKWRSFRAPRSGARNLALILLVVAGPFALSSCGRPTYPKERLAQSLEELCQREYGLKVQAVLAETTLGVLAPIPGLVDELRRRAAEGPGQQLPAVLVQGRYANQALDFQVFTQGEFTRVRKETWFPGGEEGKPEEPAEPFRKLQKVSTAIHRVALSTDAKLEFYTLIARDPGPDKLDVIFTGHISDSKRVQFYAISIGELQNRSAVIVRYQPEAVARETVRGFLADVEQQPLPELLARYTAPSRRYEQLLPKFFLVAMALEGRGARLMGEEWPARQVSADRVLVHVPLASVGNPGAILFEVQIQESAGAFLNITHLDEGAPVPGHETLGSPEEWGDFFYLERISLAQFVTEQITKRVAAEFRPLDPGSEEDPEAERASPEDVTRVLAETAAYVVDNYDFSEFHEISVVDVLRGTRWVIPASDLALYRRRAAPELRPVP